MPDEMIETEYEIVDELKERPRKWLPGEDRVESVDELLQAVEDGTMLFTGRRSVHPAWVGNQGLLTLRRQIAGGRIRYAVINPMYINWLRAELKAAEEAYS